MCLSSRKQFKSCGVRGTCLSTRKQFKNCGVDASCFCQQKSCLKVSMHRVCQLESNLKVAVLLNHVFVRKKVG